MPNSVIVEIPFDLLGAVVVPVAAILVSAAIALWITSRERVRAEKDRVRAQAIELIRSLNGIGRAAAALDMEALDEANLRYEQELNAFAGHLDGRDVAVAKYICIVVNQSDSEPLEHMWRTMLWLATAIELWLRGQLKSRDFAAHMPADTTSWVEKINLGDRGAVLRGLPAIGIADLDSNNSGVAG
ncbi:hypothetical protein LVJ59_16265 [Microbacterium sp. KKR3/1]|uniref:hypothetical protein n=1 Tax=Microbacterium sp. KKR3/1 TaxID=2904241 RepID=UPI001E4F8D74|nr:hypothetical protein [Microbacterium sp. KKR3/1]MCE0510604.1 hypothetical protein [Microbacterium sp. KKR3/1]